MLWLDRYAMVRHYGMGLMRCFSFSKYEPPLGCPSEPPRPGMGGAGRNNPAARRASNGGPPLDRPRQFSRPEMGNAGHDNPTALRTSNHGPPNGHLPLNSEIKNLPKPTGKKEWSATSALQNLAKDLSLLPTGTCTHDEVLGAIKLPYLVRPALGADPVQQLIACIEQSAEADRASVPKCTCAGGCPCVVESMKCTSRAWYKDFVAHFVLVQWKTKDPSFTPEV